MEDALEDSLLLLKLVVLGLADQGELLHPGKIIIKYVSFFYICPFFLPADELGLVSHVLLDDRD